MYQGNAIDYFPVNSVMKTPRAGQRAVINEIDKVIKEGRKKLIILEAPVGSGKSGVAMTFAKAFNSSHIITPRKSLQDQYFSDFSDEVVLMKGRSGYPCTYEKPITVYKKVIKDIVNGQVKQPGFGETNCSNAPCKDSKTIYTHCVETKGECPYSVAIEIAQQNPRVIHNIHSFVFQTSFSDKFTKRDLLVIDEAHDIEGIIREFITKKVTINKVIQEKDRPSGNDLDLWCNFFLQSEFIPKLTKAEEIRKREEPYWNSPLDEYLNKIENLRSLKTYYKDGFIIKSSINSVGSRDISTSFEFIPESLGNSADNLLFSYGEYVLLMSGTIYSKDTFCKNLGINPDTAHFIRIPSTFPKENRPLVAKSEYQIDTSFAKWNENFKDMIEKMNKILNIFDDAKGLIHAPSYEAAEQIALALNGNRAITHGKHDFQDRLQEFYRTESNKVFISPVCQQGVDFKQDRARFQIITRVPYLNTSDDFINHKVQNDFSWYNHQALVIFGQQIGRINRSEDDYGATFLMDERFNRFIKRNASKFPKWVLDAIIWK
jgi:Rad3-related DNA helicase